MNDIPPSPILGALRIDAARCRDFEESSRLEWLESDGLGGYACGTVAGVLTRRYHALLIAALLPPVERRALLSHLDETLEIGGPGGAPQRVELASHAWAEGPIQPRGFELLSGFALDPWPTWTYELAGRGALRREVAMLHERAGVVIRYAWEGTEPLALTLRPFFAWRDYHDILKRRPAGEIKAVPANKEDDWKEPLTAWRFSPFHPPLRGPIPSKVAVFLNANAPLAFQEEERWAEGFAYAIEQERGDPEPEDKHSPGEFSTRLEPGQSLALWFGMEPLEAEVLDALLRVERERRAALTLPAYPDHPDARLLARAADQFIVRRGSGLATVVAGYPWFTDWGRDTMISLPGLALDTGRLAEAEGMLFAFAEATDRGMIPNRFPDEGEAPAYNTIDASLWFFEAAGQWLEAGGNRELFHRRLWPVFQSILKWHERGTRHNIGVDPSDGLLRGGETGTQLTWMDAKVDDEVFTPRHGKAVEINALWVNALRRMAEWAQDLGELHVRSHCDDLADRAADSFEEKFWNEERGYLFDVIESDGPQHRDPALRPNQILAVSLWRTPLPPELFQPVLEAVEKSLAAPMGLRSLASEEPGYFGFYGGSRYQRDSQYHNGPVWGWLLGPYVSAVFRVRGDSPETRQAMRAYLRPVLEFLRGRGLGQIAEIYDGDAPRAPRGCFAQAWSVAEAIRVLARHRLLDEEPETV
jgi:predicted glycogen debranching enzyme